MIRASKRHLSDVGENYFEHLRFASKVGAVAIRGGIACFAHALVPALFPATGSSAIRRLNQLIDERNAAADSPQATPVAIPSGRSDPT